MRRMGIGLGVGINRSNYAQGIFNAYSARVVADGGVVEGGSCVDAVSSLLQSASLLLIPSGYKGGKLYAEIPTNGNGDLTWTRASTALRTNSSGLLESMGSGVPRLSYMYGSCPALLLEPQRTNQYLYSQDLTQWTKSGTITVTGNDATSPDGTTTADRVQFAASTNLLYISNSGSTGTNVLSVWAKAKSGTSQKFRFFANGTTTVSSDFTATDQWQRFTFSFTYSALTAGLQGASTGSSDVLFWGFQHEVGAYETTIIPTTSATATRVADTFSRSNIYTNGLITSSGGTWFVELRGNVSYTRDGSGFIGIGDTSALTTNSLVIFCPSTSSRLQIAKFISTVGTTLYTTTTDTVKVAIKWNGTSCDVFVNGTKQVSATAFTTTNMEFLQSSIQVPTFIQKMSLHPEPLTDAKLIELTTL